MRFTEFTITEVKISFEVFSMKIIPTKMHSRRMNIWKTERLTEKIVNLDIKRFKGNLLIIFISTLERRHRK